MKLKLSLDKNALQQFFLQHVEKIVFGGIVLLGLLILYGAFGRAGYTKRPSDLMGSVNNTEQHLARDRTEEVAKEFRPEDYPAIAERSRIPTEEKYYAHLRPWDLPLGKKDVRRGAAPVLAIRDLKAQADRGALALVTSTSTGAAMEGHHWILLTGLVPVREQYTEYLKTFGASAYYDPQVDVPSWSYFIVERAEVPPGGSAEGLDYQVIDAQALRAVIQRLRQFTPETELFPQFAGRLTLPLPVRLDKPWGDEVYPQAITGPTYAQVRANPDAFKGKRVTWTADGGFEDQNRVIYPRRPFGSPRSAPLSYFAIEYPTADLARQNTRQPIVVGVVAGVASVTVPSDDSRTGQKVTVPLLKYRPEGTTTDPTGPTNPLDDPLAGLGRPGGEMEGPRGNAGYEGATSGEGMGSPGYTGAERPEFWIFRFLDLDVKAGRSYVYRVKLVLANPNFGRPVHQMLDPKEAQKRVIESPETDPTDVVAIPSNSHLLTLSVGQSRTAVEPTGRIAVVKWLTQNGAEAHEDFATWRGAVLSFPETKFPPTPPGTKAAKKEKDKKASEREAATAYEREGDSHDGERVGPPNRGGTASVEPPPLYQVNVDYSVDAMTLDMRGTDRLPGRSNVTEVGEILVLDEDGRLRVYSETEGKSEFDAREEAVKARTVSTDSPTVPGGLGEGGLDFR